jgi:hypothetical protein
MAMSSHAFELTWNLEVARPRYRLRRVLLVVMTVGMAVLFSLSAVETADLSGVPRVRVTGGSLPFDAERLVYQVAELRGQSLERDLEVVVLNDAAWRLRFGSDVGDRGLNNSSWAFNAFGLMPEEEDVAEILDGVLRDSYAGLYDARSKKLFIRTGSGIPVAEQKLTVAHEMAHALQDQRYDLDEVAWDTQFSFNDGALAAGALIEGDAMRSELMWAEAYQPRLTGEVRWVVKHQAYGLSRQELLREFLIFPYAHGYDFVQFLAEQGGQAAIDRAFASPPWSTEQILHPQKYVEQDNPTRMVEVYPEPRWVEEQSTTLGELELRFLLAPIGSQESADAAAGWEGGLTAVFRDDKAVAIQTQAIFETRADAVEACAALHRWYEDTLDGQEWRPGWWIGRSGWMTTRCRGEQVAMGVAPDKETAADLAGF